MTWAVTLLASVKALDFFRHNNIQWAALTLLSVDLPYYTHPRWKYLSCFFFLPSIFYFPNARKVKKKKKQGSVLYKVRGGEQWKKGRMLMEPLSINGALTNLIIKWYVESFVLNYVTTIATLPIHLLTAPSNNLFINTFRSCSFSHTSCLYRKFRVTLDIPQG